jgi:GcrA cell cycle regulator
MTMHWDKLQTELLTRLWLAGNTARTIAEKLGGGITRNAVIGKAHRLGLTGKQGSKSTALKRTRTAPPKMSSQQPERKPRPKNRARERREC